MGTGKCFLLSLLLIVGVHRCVHCQAVCPDICTDYAKNQEDLKSTLLEFRDKFVRLEKENVELKDRLKNIESVTGEIQDKVKAQSKKIRNIEATLDSLGKQEWEEWNAWTTCSVTCGTGILQRSRKCVGQSQGEKNCNGSATETKPCYGPSCPGAARAAWSRWSNWSECSVSCGVGSKKRARTCVGEKSQCIGRSETRSSCYQGFCRRDRDWATWGEWSKCSVTCGKGEIRRTRICTGGEGKCRGSPESVAKCFRSKCPNDYEVVDKKCQVLYKEKCYMIIDAASPIGRPEHARLCSEYDGHLTNIYDAEHFEKINKYIAERRLGGNYLWTGMNYTAGTNLTLHDGSKAEYFRWMSSINPVGHWLWTGILFHAFDDSRLERLGLSSLQGLMPRAGYRNMVPDSPYRYSICEFDSE